MYIRTAQNKIDSINLKIVYRIDNFIKQKLDYHLTCASMSDIIYNETLLINSISEQVQADLSQYLTTILKHESYRLLVDQMKYLSQYVDAIINMWVPAIKAALQNRIAFIQSSYLEAQVA